MKRPLIILILIGIVLLLFSSCICDDDKETQNDDTTDYICNHPYFPMKTGNSWSYRLNVNNNIYSFEIVDDADGVFTFNERPPFLLYVEYDNMNHGPVSRHGLSFKNNGLLYAHYDDLELPYVNLTEEDNERISTIKYYSELRSTDETVETDYGFFTNCKKYFIISNYISDCEITVWLAPGIGPVMIQEGPINIYLLTGYNNQYGDHHANNN